MKRSFIVLVPRLSAPTTLRPRDWKKSVAPAPASHTLNTAHYLDQGKYALSFSLPTSIGRESWMKKNLLAFDQRLVWKNMWNKYYSLIFYRLSRQVSECNPHIPHVCWSIFPVLALLLSFCQARRRPLSDMVPSLHCYKYCHFIPSYSW